MFFLLAALIKVSEGMGFVIIQGLFLLGYFGLAGLQKSLYRKHIFWKSGSLIFVAVPVIMWNLYAAHFNKIHHNGMSLLGTIPVWKMKWYDIEITFNRFANEWAPDMHSYFILLLVLTASGYFFVYFRKMNVTLRTMTCLSLAGIIGYSLLFFQAFYHHDYYMLTCIIFPLFVVITIVEYLGRTKFIILYRKHLVLVAVLVFIYVIFYNRKIQLFRYKSGKYTGVNTALFNIEPYLRSIGIDRQDLVVSVPDKSPNISLYLMNNPGWTEAFNSDNYNIYYFKNQGAKYLIVSDSSYLQNDFYKPFYYNKIGTYRDVSIFKL